ncbi:ArnT family glycosyltransferase [Acidobacteriota bacterium]
MLISTFTVGSGRERQDTLSSPEPRRSKPEQKGDVAQDGTARTSGRDSGYSSRWIIVLLVMVLCSSFLLRLWWGLKLEHLWDENFSLDNAASIVLTGSLEPDNGYYPLLSYFPQALLLGAGDYVYRETQNFTFYTLKGKRPSAQGRRLCRITQVIYGTLTLVVIFLVGNRLFCRRVGLLAALAAGFSTTNIWAWGYFKPDALLGLTVMLALLWSLRILDKQTIPRCMLATVGVALAMSSKIIGCAIAAALILAIILCVQGVRRKLACLTLSGAVSGLTFVLLNPYLKSNLHFIEVLSREYAWKAEAKDMDRIVALKKLLFEYMPDILGIPVLLFFCIGLVLILTKIFNRKTPLARRAGYSLVLSYLVAFPVLYLAKTPYFKAYNFASITPFYLLVSCSAIVALWDMLGRRIKIRLPFMILFCILALLWITPSFLYIYRTLIPTTEDVAIKYLLTKFRPAHVPAMSRFVYSEAVNVPLPPWQGRGRLNSRIGVLVASERLDDVSLDLLDAADGEIYLENNVSQKDDEFFRRRFGPDVARVKKRLKKRMTTVKPSPFKLRGPELVAIAHPWKLLEPPRALARRRTLDGITMIIPPDVSADETLSLIVTVVSQSLGGNMPSVEIGDRAYPLHWIARGLGKQLFITPRFELPDKARYVTLRRKDEKIEDASVELYRWSKPSVLEVRGIGP